MKRYLIILLSVAAVISSCVKEVTAVADKKQEDKTLTADPCLIPGEIIVEFTEEFTLQVEKDFAEGHFLQTRAGCVGEVFAALGVTSVERLYDDGGEWEERHRAAGLHRWYRIRYDDSLPSTKAGADLSAISGVVYVEPVRRIKSTATFNDPQFSSQWHYYNDGSKTGMQAGSDINVVPVWEKYTAGSPNVIVSIVDGGIQLDHPDLVASTIPAGPNGSKSFVQGFTGYTIYPHDHGTHVAGTVGATNNNGVGVCGVAGGSDGKGGVKLMSCAIFKANPDDPSRDLGGDSWNAMVWGADHGAVISQNSWGYDYKTPEEAKNGSVGSMKSAIDYFIKYAGCDKDGNQLPDSPMKGGVVIFAAGNDAWPDGWPAKYEPCVAVGSFGADYARAYYSNYGDWVDICAPGGDAYKGYEVLSTVTGSRYGKMQGTSMACPHVSGVAALIVSYFGGQGFTNEMLLERLISGADNTTKLASAKIGPKLDAFGSFNYGGTVAPDPVETFGVRAQANSLVFDWKLTGDDDATDGRCYSYYLLASKKRSDFDDFRPSAVPAGMSAYKYIVGNDLAVGDGISAVLSNLDFDSGYYAAIVGCDYSMNLSAMSEVKSVNTLSNNAPVIETSYTGDYKVHSHETLVINYNIYDPDGHDIEVSYRKGSDADSFSGTTEGGYKLTIVGNAVPAGHYSAILSVSDIISQSGYSKTTAKTVSYEVLPNHAPQVIKPLPGVLMSRRGEVVEIDMSEYILDEDGEVLEYTVTHTNSKIGNINPSGNILTLTSLNFGIDEVTILATDCRGETCSMDFKLVVREPSAEADVYPSVVRDYLTISAGAETETWIRVYSSSGQLVFEDTCLVGAFTPAKVDMRDFAPGTYYVKITINGITTERTIVKY